MLTKESLIPLTIWGAAGHALVVADIIRLQEVYEVTGFLDDINQSRHSTEFCGQRILGGREQLPILLSHGIKHILLGFGHCSKRLELTDLVEKMGFFLPTAIHPNAIIAQNVTIGAGTVVAAGAVVNPEATIGRSAIINTSASVDHECVVGDGSHVCPGAHLAGRVNIGNAVHIGIAATVIEGVRIGDRSIIGAGAVVIRDIPEDVVAYGIPARIRRKITNGH